MSTEQGLYAQVVTIHQKYSDHKKEKENTKKYNLQGKSTRPIIWFDLDHELLEGNLRTHEPDFYKSFIKTILGVMIRKQFNYL